jgi:glycosyltransferase involved in cell wall biosynthesis
LQWSENESYSIVVAEAIACGLPVLATKTGNWRHFAQSGLVELLARDDADETAGILAGLIGDEQQYGRLRPVDGWSNRMWDDAGREFHSWLMSTA